MAKKRLVEHGPQPEGQDKQTPGAQPEGQEEQEEQAPGPTALQAKEALQAKKVPHQQGQQASPGDVPLKDLGSAESVCDSTATTSTNDSGKSTGVQETVLISIDKDSREDLGKDARGGEPGPSHESSAAASAGVQQLEGGPEKTPSNASDDIEGARDDDEQPLLKTKKFVDLV